MMCREGLLFIPSHTNDNSQLSPHPYTLTPTSPHPPHPPHPPPTHRRVNDAHVQQCQEGRNKFHGIGIFLCIAIPVTLNRVMQC